MTCLKRTTFKLIKLASPSSNQETQPLSVETSEPPLTSNNYHEFKKFEHLIPDDFSGSESEIDLSIPTDRQKPKNNRLENLMVYLEGKDEERQSILGSIKAVGPKVYEYLVKLEETRFFNFGFSGKSLSFSHAGSSAGEEHFHSADGYRLHLSRIFDILPGWWQKSIKVKKARQIF